MHRCKQQRTLQGEAGCLQRLESERAQLTRCRSQSADCGGSKLAPKLQHDLSHTCYNEDSHYRECCSPVGSPGISLSVCTITSPPQGYTPLRWGQKPIQTPCHSSSASSKRVFRIDGIRIHHCPLSHVRCEGAQRLVQGADSWCHSCAQTSRLDTVLRPRSPAMLIVRQTQSALNPVPSPEQVYAPWLRVSIACIVAARCDGCAHHFCPCVDMLTCCSMLMCIATRLSWPLNSQRRETTVQGVSYMATYCSLARRFLVVVWKRHLDAHRAAH